jgi:RTA1 like protein
MSSNSSGNSTVGVNIAIAGLTFQVFTLSVFSFLAIDYAIRYLRGRRAGEVERRQLTLRFKIFVGFLVLAILLILIRSIYRIDELHSGYRGRLLHNEGLFIGLEGV